MRGHLSFQRGVLVAVLAALAGCFPDFEFGTSTGGHGQGGEPSSSRAGPGPTVGSGGQHNDGGDPGQGGIPGHMPASSTTTDATTDTSTSTGPGMPLLTVPCGDGSGTIVECATEPESCCLSLEAQSMDHCQPTDDCGVDYYTLSCNGPADCPGQICCALIDGFFGDLLGVQCQATCGGDNYVVCAVAGDCAVGETCDQLFSNSFAPEYAPHYRVCQ